MPSPKRRPEAGLPPAEERPLSILIMAEGSEGDLRPALAVAVRLRQLGHVVRASVSEEYADRFRSRDIDVVASSPLGMSFFRDQPKAAYGGIFAYYNFVLRTVAEVVERQAAVAERYAPDTDAVFACGFIVGAQSVAERFGIPFLHAVPSAVFFPSSETPPPGVPFVHLPFPINATLWALLIAVLDRAMLHGLNKVRSGLKLPPLATVRRYLTDHLILMTDAELCPLPAVYVARGFQTVSYPEFDDGAELDPELIAFINDGEPPVYVGFGSMLDESGDLLELTLEAVRRAGRRAVIGAGLTPGGGPLGAGTVAGSADPPDRRPAPGVYLAPPSPYLRLFPLVAAVVHHGGAGAVRIAAAAGRPQVVVAHLLDQYYMGDRLYRLGLGPPPLDRRRLTAQKLAATLVYVSCTSAYRKNAAVLAKKLAGRDGAGELADAVEARITNPQ